MIEGLSGCEETHEDGSPHIHINVKLKHGVSKANLLNRLRKKYPNDYKRIDIRPTRQNFKQADYLFKEDLAPYSWENPDYVTGGIVSQKKWRQKAENWYINSRQLLSGVWDDWKLDVKKTMEVYDAWMESDDGCSNKLPPTDGDIWVNCLGEYKTYEEVTRKCREWNK